MNRLARRAPRFLVVDRSEEWYSAIEEVVRDRMDDDTTVDWSMDAMDAARALEGRRHDAVLFDFAADAAAGGPVLRTALASGAAPVALLEGARDKAVEEQALDAGAADFLWKAEISAPLVGSVLRNASGARDRARLERQLHLGQRMETIGRLAGGIAHEFNNILTAVVGFGTLLAEHLSGDEAATAQVREILGGAERATMLTRDLLAFSRRQVLRPTQVDLADVVEHLARMLRGVLGSNIDLQVRCAAGLPAIRADRAQIEQAITNLAIYARDAMPSGGRLIVELDEITLDAAYCDAHESMAPGRYVRLCVSDTGVGIPRELLSSVFEPFFTTRDSTASAGLGLSTTYGIVKQSGGNIWAYSERGLGTTFKLYFPAHAEAPAGNRGPAAAVANRLEGNETILLVDDTDMVRRIARDVLTGAGYRVLEAAGADEAIQVAGGQSLPIDLLVTDVVMPGRNGVELAERLRTARAEVRVLFISGYTESGIVRDGLLSSDAAFLQKPFTPEDLLRKVRQVLELN